MDVVDDVGDLLLSLMQHAAETDGEAQFGVDAMLRLIDRAHVSERRKVELRNDTAALLANLESTAVVLRHGESLDPGRPRAMGWRGRDRCRRPGREPRSPFCTLTPTPKQRSLRT